MRVPLLMACLTLLGPGIPSRCQAQAAEPIAVILNRRNPEDGLAVEDLRHLYLGVRTRFPSRAPVLLLALPRLAPRFYTTALDMTEPQLRRYWIGLVFSGDSAVPPKEVSSAAELKRLVAKYPGAVGFIPLGEVDSSVKAVTIDGLRPGDPRYALR